VVPARRDGRGASDILGQVSDYIRTAQKGRIVPIFRLHNDLADSFTAHLWGDPTFHLTKPNVFGILLLHQAEVRAHSKLVELFHFHPCLVGSDQGNAKEVALHDYAEEFLLPALAQWGNIER
jgi:hypothetical protein